MINQNLAKHILIVDDHPVVLDGIQLLLSSLRPSAAYSTATCGKEALAMLESDKGIDWLFIDINLPDINGLELVKIIKSNKMLCKVVVLSSEIDAKTINQALLLGIDGVLSKSFSKEVFELCLLTIDLGKVFLTPEHDSELKYYRASVGVEEDYIKSQLSKRHLELLNLLDKGMTNKKISLSMGITESTVKSHMTSLMSIFEADNRTHCLVKARELDLI